VVGCMKIPYTLRAWILKSMELPSAQKVSSVKTLYAWISMGIYILSKLVLYYNFLNDRRHYLMI
jgi:hypothetical protein